MAGGPGRRRAIEAERVFDLSCVGGRTRRRIGAPPPGASERGGCPAGEGPQTRQARSRTPRPGPADLGEPDVDRPGRRGVVQFRSHLRGVAQSSGVADPDDLAAPIGCAAASALSEPLSDGPSRSVVPEPPQGVSSWALMRGRAKREKM